MRYLGSQAAHFLRRLMDRLSVIWRTRLSAKPPIRQADITKAVRGLTAAGVGGAVRVEIAPSGKIIITTGTGEPAVSLGETPEDLKRLL